jgi:integrase/recombinase XerD
MSLEDIIANYITHQRSLGKRYSGEATILAAFGRSVSDVPVRDIRPEMISRFVDREGTGHETRSKKHRVLSDLFFFAVTRRLLRTSPMPQRLRQRVYPSYVPYIYSEAELKRLLAAVPAATTGSQRAIDADTLRALLLLLYGAGLRRGEAMRLRIEDVDISQSLIHVRQTKFFKTRIVPLSDSLATVIRAFIARPGNHYSTGRESRLFSSRDGTPLSSTTLGVAFRHLCTIAGIGRNGGARNQPRMHDLRHSAAVHRVIAWYRSDADLNDLLPKLATYLGHTGLSGTQRYLTMTQELLAEASCRFEAFAGGHRHD